jgi:citrate synthase
MLQAVHETGDPEGYVCETLAAGERLMGFGHRVYRVRDPRAAVLSAAAERVYGEDGGAARRADGAFFETARAFEDVAVDLLAEHKPDRRLETNVEFYTAVLLDGVGVPRDLFTPTFAVGRAGGWVAHCLEQLEDNRLVRPRARYGGASGRTWTPIEER